MRIFAAPLQGFTESLWRRLHSEVYGPCVEAYFSPFVRLEKGEVRRKDLRDISPDDALTYRLIPQIIFKDIAEFDLLADSVAALGYREIDLNLGCPFPLQTARGRGAALIGHPEVLEAVCDSMNRRQDVSFSVKMRLGMESPDEWMTIMDVLERMPLDHVTLHPRTARQGYDGELHYDMAEEFLKRSSHPVVFNGNLLTVTDCRTTAERFPGIEGLMIGRGLLARPSLGAELREGREWSREERMEHLLRFHSMIEREAMERYCGESQILSKLKPFWEYLEPEIGRRAFKAISKAGSLTRYKAAVASAFED